MYIIDQYKSLIFCYGKSDCRYGINVTQLITYIISGLILWKFAWNNFNHLHVNCIDI